MKTVEKIINPVKRAGEESPGKIYNEKLKVRGRREWRGLKDTLYDYSLPRRDWAEFFSY